MPYCKINKLNWNYFNSREGSTIANKDVLHFIFKSVPEDLVAFEAF